MAVNWTLTRERIADKALEKCQVIGAYETPAAADRALCLEALDGILKNLMWFGIGWPKTISAYQTLTLTANVQNTTLPTDFYGNAMLSYLDASSNEVPLPLVSAEQWKSIVLKTSAGSYPDRAYIDNFNVLWTYPRQNQTVTARLYYSAVIADTVANTAVGLDSPWYLGLAKAVAAEVGDEFDVPDSKIMRWSQEWAGIRALGIMSEAAPGPDRITVSD